MKCWTIPLALASVGLLATACGGGGEDETPAVGEAGVEAGHEASRVGSKSAESVAPLLVDASAGSGVDFVHDSGASGGLVFPEMMGGGVAVFDADADGDLDLYFASGGSRFGEGGVGNDGVNRLYLRDPSGRYIDSTDSSGLGDPGYSTGIAVGDFDNDGNEDVFVANIGPDRLYRGLGGARFADVTETSGVQASGVEFDDWSTSAAFCDLDRDGYLDLYVVRYVEFDPSVRCTDTTGRPEYCGPDSFIDRRDVLLRNRGDGTFQDITSSAGIDAVFGAGLGVVCADFDDDGWVDIYVANDGDPNQLWVNRGAEGIDPLRFVDEALIQGTSVNASGLEEAGMGVVAADFDNDADFDLFLTHLRDETNTLYRNLGAGVGFQDDTHQTALAAASTPFTGFGTAPVDLDLDGDLDLVISNGRVKRAPPLTDAVAAPWRDYAEPNQAYGNEAGEFRMLGHQVAAFTVPIEIGRGLASGDLDGDGDLDLVLNNLQGPARIYHGAPASGHWLLVDTVDPELGRRAIGARVVLTRADSRQVRTVQGAMSYLSSSDPRAHFGLGDLADSGAPVDLEVRWPDGKTEQFSGVAVDQVVVLEKGTGSP